MAHYFASQLASELQFNRRLETHRKASLSNISRIVDTWQSDLEMTFRARIGWANCFKPKIGRL